MAHDKRKLLPRQAKFIDTYLLCLNGAEAARQAGYKDGRYPASIASKLLADPRIRNEINRRIRAQTRMPSDEILARLERQANASIAMFLKPGTLEIDPDAVREHGDLVQSVWMTAEGPRLRLHDAQKALELLGKARALFIERQILEQMEGMDIVEDEATTSTHSLPARSSG